MGVRFSTPIQTGPGAHPASYTKGAGSFPAVQRPGRGADHPPPSNAEVKERVELHNYYPSGPLVNFTFAFLWSNVSFFFKQSVAYVLTYFKQNFLLIAIKFYNLEV